jgi:dTDP-4-amino-4,6-dideoxy-D-galactose acyltransferase
MAIFVENSVKGFADEVIVPKNGAANAFLTANFLTSPLSLTQERIGKMVLSAVSPERKGWYVRLIAEMSYIFKEQGLNTAFMSTQATNRAVLKVWFRHGYRFGRCTHIFSTYIRTKAAS